MNVTPNRLGKRFPIPAASGAGPDMPGLTCGTCKHWHRHPTDPKNLAAPPFGECRGGPPSLLATPMGPAAMYPQLPPDFPACRVHAAQLHLADIPDEGSGTPGETPADAS